MPFDALVAAAPRDSLTNALDRRGVIPISPEFLASHKLAQLQKFGPSFWYRHQTFLSLLLFIASPAAGVAVAATHGFAPFWNSVSIGVCFGWLAMMALMSATGLIRMRAGSHWEERWVSPAQFRDLAVPQPIARLATTLQRDLPGSTLILGELMREQAVLDPYLLLEHGDDCVCLGIWDGDDIVAVPPGQC